jgi:hypothetical protein
MHLEAVGRSLRYRLKSGEEFVLRPGQSVDLPNDTARRLLRQAGDRIRVVPDVVVQAAAVNAVPIYWEAENGIWHGPVKPKSLGRLGEQFYVVVTYRGVICPILPDRLRSRQAFETNKQGCCQLEEDQGRAPLESLQHPGRSYR